MTAAWAGIASRWDALDDRERRDTYVVGLLIAAFLVHYAIYSWWFVEDAAISFSYARNAADGLGFVTYAGGERVEGFSNPTWTLLLTLFQALGVTPFITAKLLGAAFGAMTLPLSLRWARALRGKDDPWAWLAPGYLAASPQFVEWAASGLENSLVVVLIAWGAVRAIEGDDPKRPDMALPMLILALSRPEAPAYAGIIALWHAWMMARRSGVRAALTWCATFGVAFLVPFLAIHALFWGYFGYPLPNTYYAKLGDGDKFEPLVWNGKGWPYLRGWALESGMGFVLPGVALGLVGLTRRRMLVAGALIAVCFIAVFPGIAFLSVIPHWPWSPPKVRDAAYMLFITFRQWEIFRIAALGVGFTALVSLAGTRPNGAPRVLALALLGFAWFFALYSGGDWMRGYRWFSPPVVPLAVLIADAAGALIGGLDAAGYARARWWMLAWVAGVPVAVGVGESMGLIGGPETMPFDVYRRVIYMQGVQRRLHVDHVTLMDVDMGAHMWWSGFDIIDMAGLVDVPMGHHKWQTPFVRQYVFQEKKPEFAHVHDSWAKKTRMTTHPEFRANYIEIDPFPTSPWTAHAGNHVRRDLILARSWPWDDDRAATYADGLRLAGLYTPTPEVAPGQSLYVDIGFMKPKKGTPFRAVVFIAGNGRVVTWDAPPAYDWIAPAQWRPDEVADGRHSLHLPADLPVGDYDLGVLMLGTGADDGAVLPPIDVGTGTTDDPQLARGELRWKSAVHVVPKDVAERHAADDLARVDVDVASGLCDLAEYHWSVARRHLDRDDPWHLTADPRADAALAQCWAHAAANAAGATAITDIGRARRWDPSQPDAISVGVTIGASRGEQGEQALAKGDAKAAYALLRDALIADPSRADLRVKAERARDSSLGIGSDDTPAVSGGGGD